MRDGCIDNTPSDASAHAAKPVGLVLDRWSWAEFSVWTDRMLMALPHVQSQRRFLNALFAERGPLSFNAAYASELRQSSRR